jgi:hypothetical protein
VTDVSTSFIGNIISFDEAFKYGGGTNFLGYVGTKAEPLCVKFSTFFAISCLCKLFDLLLNDVR